MALVAYIKKHLGISELEDRVTSIEDGRERARNKKASAVRRVRRNKKWMKLQEGVPLTSEEVRDWEAGT